MNNKKTNHKILPDGTVQGYCYLCGRIYTGYTYGKLMITIAKHCIESHPNSYETVNWAIPYKDDYETQQAAQRTASKIRKLHEIDHDNQFIH